MNSKKCNELASQQRNAGNLHYKSSRFYDALVCYNKSLCHAVPGSQEFSLAVANRSAVYMEVKEYERCLENIQLALDCGYPKEKMQTLLDRQDKALDLMECHEASPHDDPWSFFRLSHAANPKIPFVVDCLELRESKKTFGKGLITLKALNAGDVIAIEEPFYKFIFNGARFVRCANCLKCECLNLFPCLECNYSK